MDELWQRLLVLLLTFVGLGLYIWILVRLVRRGWLKARAEARTDPDSRVRGKQYAFRVSVFAVPVLAIAGWRMSQGHSAMLWMSVPVAVLYLYILVRSMTDPEYPPPPKS